MFDQEPRPHNERRLRDGGVVYVYDMDNGQMWEDYDHWSYVSSEFYDDETFDKIYAAAQELARSNDFAGKHVDDFLAAIGIFRV